VSKYAKLHFQPNNGMLQLQQQQKNTRFFSIFAFPLNFLRFFLIFFSCIEIPPSLFIFKPKYSFANNSNNYTFLTDIESVLSIKETATSKLQNILLTPSQHFSNLTIMRPKYH